MSFVPAVSAEALLTGMQACGIDIARIRKLARLAPRYVDPSEMLPISAWEAIWHEGARLDPRPELPTLAAAQVPFGLFGSLDYLAGSAQTVRVDFKLWQTIFLPPHPASNSNSTSMIRMAGRCASPIRWQVPASSRAMSSRSRSS